MAATYIFEGSEKKLEIMVELNKFQPAIESLRELPRTIWADLVRASGAQILSELASSDCTAYLLSESSLFVFDDRIVMITCGRTKLVKSAKVFIDKFGIGVVQNFFFERKNEAFPKAQRSSFEEDCEGLSALVPGVAQS